MGGTLKEDIYEAYFILQEMTDKTNNYKTFSDELEHQGKLMIVRLGIWKSDESFAHNVLENTKELIKGQIEVNNMLKEHYAKIWANEESRVNGIREKP